MSPELIATINKAIEELANLINDDKEVDGEITGFIVSKYATTGTQNNFCVSAKVSHPNLGTEPSFYQYSAYINAETLHTEYDSTWL